MPESVSCVLCAARVFNTIWPPLRVGRHSRICWINVQDRWQWHITYWWYIRLQAQALRVYAAATVNSHGSMNDKTKLSEQHILPVKSEHNVHISFVLCSSISETHWLNNIYMYIYDKKARFNAAILGWPLKLHTSSLLPKNHLPTRSKMSNTNFPARTSIELHILIVHPPHIEPSIHIAMWFSTFCWSTPELVCQETTYKRLKLVACTRHAVRLPFQPQQLDCESALLAVCDVSRYRRLCALPVQQN